MIPKTIHYCWFGRGEMPRLTQRCIKSWEKHCPDYTIVEWNEDNFDINMNAYTRSCYQNKQWAFLSDYVRLVVVYENGGIYFDTDVEVIRSFDDLLEAGAFFGFENKKYVATGLGFGAEVHHNAVRSMLNEYVELLDGKHDVVKCPQLNTQGLLPLGLKQNGQYQVLADNTVVYPTEYFNPLDDATGIMNITDNTYSINRYGKSWMSKSTRIRSRLTRPLHRIFGTDFFRKH